MPRFRVCQQPRLCLALVKRLAERHKILAQLRQEQRHNANTDSGNDASKTD